MKIRDFKSEEDLKKMKVADIKKHVKEFNDHYAIKGYSKLNKSQLINTILTAQKRISTASAKPTAKPSAKPIFKTALKPASKPASKPETTDEKIDQLNKETLEILRKQSPKLILTPVPFLGKSMKALYDKLFEKYLAKASKIYDVPVLGEMRVKVWSTEFFKKEMRRVGYELKEQGYSFDVDNKTVRKPKKK